MNKQSLIYTVVFTFLVCFAFVFLLALTNEATREQVELNEVLKERRAILSAFGIEFVDDAEVQERYADVEEIRQGEITLYRAVVDGETIYAKQFAGPGLWGTIFGVLGVYESGDTTSGIEIINQNETPGLGGRVGEEWFKAQYRGERIIDGRIEVAAPGEGDPDHTNGRVDGITGATRTSDSIEAIVNRELALFQATLGEI